MFGLFRKEDPNLMRNREAQQLREMQQVWKKNLEPDDEAASAALAPLPYQLIPRECRPQSQQVS
jgi:hypothetical protein